MMHSPLALDVLFHIGPVPVTTPVAVTWGIMLSLAGGAFLLTRRLTISPGKTQTVLELLVDTVDEQIIDTMQTPAPHFRALIGSLFIFILACNWISLIPGIEPPTAHIETDAALALVVFATTVFEGIRVQGFKKYCASFAEPTWVMLPLNILEQITRTFSMMVRLFGNVMSGVFVVAIVLSLAGLLVPIPLMALDLLTGAVQAYIFTVLAMVFIGAAISQNEGRPRPPPESINPESKP